MSLPAEPSRYRRLQLPVFAYGTLRRGESNYWLLRGCTVKELPASLDNALLYALRTYPVLVESAEASASVSGELMIIHPASYAGIIPEMDDLEGVNPGATPEEQASALYRRVKRLVRFPSGARAWAWVYVGNAPVLAQLQHELIPGGDWVRYRRDRLRRMLDADR